MTVITFTGTVVAGVISGALSGLISVLDSQPVRTKPEWYRLEADKVMGGKLQPIKRPPRKGPSKSSSQLQRSSCPPGAWSILSRPPRGDHNF